MPIPQITKKGQEEAPELISMRVGSQPKESTCGNEETKTNRNNQSGKHSGERRFREVCSRYTDVYPQARCPISGENNKSVRMGV